VQNFLVERFSASSAIPFSVGQLHWPVGLVWDYQILPGRNNAGNSLFFEKACTGMPTTTIQSPAVEEHPDVALVARAREGDTAAFEQLVRQYDRQIFRVAQHITQNREDAEDIVQDVFLKAYEKLDQFQGNSKFSTWLVRIAVNESLMRLRKRKTSRTVSMDEDVQTEEGAIPRDFADWSPNPEQIYGQSELGDILRKTIQGLPPGFRTVFTLRDIENLSTEETAEALGLSVPAVKSRLLRARLQLRERLSRYLKQPEGVKP
jgi:RNA polymerase sigma-70 factor (ECF subfamily)